MSLVATIDDRRPPAAPVLGPRPFPSRRRAASPADDAARSRLPRSVLALLICFLAPTELSLYVAGLRLPPHRVVLLALFPWALYRLLAGRGVRINLVDILLTLYASWTVCVYMLHQGAGEGLQYGGSIALECLAAYLVARVAIRSSGQMLATLKALVIAILISGLIALPEAISGVHYVHDVLREITGYVHPIGHETRLGLTRAYGTFDHPIHFGTFSASVLALAWLAHSRWRDRIATSAVIAVVTVLGLSSAPILCLGLQMLFIAWDRVTRGIPHRLAITSGAFCVAYLLLSLVMTRTPINFIATGFTLDSATGYYRTLIWQHGMENVLANPWIGIGLADWERPSWMASSTVDAYWLVTAMRTGLPAFLLMAVAILVLLAGVLKGGRRTRDPIVRQLARGWAMCLLALSLVACTVHFWNVLHTYFFFFLGTGAWIAAQRRAAPHQAPVRTRARTLPRAASGSA